MLSLIQARGFVSRLQKLQGWQVFNHYIIFKPLCHVFSNEVASQLLEHGLEHTVTSFGRVGVVLSQLHHSIIETFQVFNADARNLTQHL